MQITNSPLWVAAFFTITLSKCRNVADSGGTAMTIAVTTRSATHDRVALKDSIPALGPRNCTSSNGIASSLRNESSPFHRSSNVTSAHRSRQRPAAPAKPAVRQRASKFPGAVRPSEAREPCQNQTPTRMAVADVDHGSDTAIATARTSATVASFFRLSVVQSSAMVQVARAAVVDVLVATTAREAPARDCPPEQRQVCLYSAPAVNVQPRDARDGSTGRKYPVLPADAGVKKPGDNVRVFFSPAPIVRIEAVDTLEIGPPDGEIAGARPL